MKTMLAESATEICHVSLPGVVIFPGMSLPIKVTGESHLRAFEQAWQQGEEVLLTSTRGNAGVGCLVEIQEFRFDGDHNGFVVIHGVSRQQICSNQETLSKGKELQDIYQGAKQSDRLSKREQLLSAFYAKFPVFAENQFLLPALESELPFGTLCDVLAASCHLSDEDYARLLAAINVDQRCDLLMEILLRNVKPESESHFPPVFSVN